MRRVCIIPSHRVPDHVSCLQLGSTSERVYCFWLNSEPPVGALCEGSMRIELRSLMRRELCAALQSVLESKIRQQLSRVLKSSSLKFIRQHIREQG